MGFSFTATAQCDKCGQLLGSSDEGCSHDNQTVSKHVFRRLSEGRDSIEGVEATAGWKWYKLKERVGDDWIAYEYLGTKEHVNAMLDGSYDSVEELPRLTMSVDAPADVGEHDSDDE